MNRTPIILRPGFSVEVDGVELSYEDIKNNKIDSILFRKHLKEMMAKQGDSA